MTTDEVTLDRPEIGVGFTVICGFCRLRLSRFIMDVLCWDLRCSRLVPASEWILWIRSLFLTILLYHLWKWEFEFASLSDQYLFRVDSSRINFWCIQFSKSSRSALRIFPFQIPPATYSGLRKIPGNTFSPNWSILDWSFGEIGWYSFSAPTGIIGPLNDSPNRLSNGVFPSPRRSWTSCR